MPASIWEVVLGGLADAVQPLVDAAQAESAGGEGLQVLALEAGYDLRAVMTPTQAATFSKDISAIYQEVQKVVLNPNGFAGQIPDLINHLKSFFTTMQALESLYGASNS